MKKYKHYLFDWGNTLMVDFPDEKGPMVQWSQVKAVTGATQILSELSKIAHCHIATNAKDSSETEIRQALARADLDKYIDNIFCFQNIGFEKPSEMYFNHIISLLQVDKHEVLMIGDNLKTDVQSALDFGFDAIWFNATKHPVPEGINSIEHLGHL